MMADKPPADPNLLRRDMQAMLSFIQGARIVSMARETAVSQIQGWLLGRYWWSMASSAVAVGLIFLITWMFPILVPHRGLLCGIVLLLFVARIGALISIGRRIKDEDIGASVGADAVYALATLGSGINGLAIALMSSNAFGLVMYALFASGLPASLGISGGIAPAFQLTVGDLHTRMLAAQQDAKDSATLLQLCLDKAQTTAAQATPIETSEVGGADNATDAAPNAAVADTATTAEADSGDTTTNVTTPPAAAPSPSCDALQRRAEIASGFEKVSVDAFFTASKTPSQPAGPAGDAGQDSMLGALRYGLGLAEVSDLFKLLIWVFISGFFESLVPDMLDALAKRGEASKEKK